MATKRTTYAEKDILSMPHDGINPKLYGMVNYNKYIRPKKNSSIRFTW